MKLNLFKENRNGIILLFLIMLFASIYNLYCKLSDNDELNILLNSSIMIPLTIIGLIIILHEENVEKRLISGNVLVYFMISSLSQYIKSENISKLVAIFGFLFCLYPLYLLINIYFSIYNLESENKRLYSAKIIFIIVLIVLISYLIGYLIFRFLNW